MNIKLLNIMGVALTGAGMAVSIALTLIKDKQMDALIADKIAKAISKQA